MNRFIQYKTMLYRELEHIINNEGYRIQSKRRIFDMCSL